MGTTRMLAAVLAVLVAAGGSGCGVAPKGAGPGSAEADARIAFEPVRVTVHPLSTIRTDRETGRLQIEAHIELFDKWDHPVKGLGTVVFELTREAGVAPTVDIGEQVAKWDYAMADPEVNARAYDPVTRTYRFLLNDGSDVLRGGGPWVLGVRFTRPDDVSLSATRRLGRVGGSASER